MSKNGLNKSDRIATPPKENISTIHSGINTTDAVNVETRIRAARYLAIDGARSFMFRILFRSDPTAPHELRRPYRFPSAETQFPLLPNWISAEEIAQFLVETNDPWFHSRWLSLALHLAVFRNFSWPEHRKSSPLSQDHCGQIVTVFEWLSWSVKLRCPRSISLAVPNVILEAPVCLYESSEWW